MQSRFDPSNRTLGHKRPSWESCDVADIKGARYSERLWPSFAVWFGTAFVLLMIDAAVWAALGVPTGIGFAVLTAITAVYWLASASPTITVVDAELRAGRAHLDVGHISDVEVLDASESRAAMGRDADGRTYLVTRGWVATAVRFLITDPADPTPDWIVGSRHPIELAEAILAAQHDATSSHTAG